MISEKVNREVYEKKSQYLYEIGDYNAKCMEIERVSEIEKKQMVDKLESVVKCFN